MKKTENQGQTLPISSAAAVIKSMPLDQAIQFLKSEITGIPQTQVIEGELIVIYMAVSPNKFDINTLLRFATESCGIHLFRIKEKSRKKEIVFARYLVIWYLKKYMDHNFYQAGTIFEKNHSTAIYGFNIIDADPKFLTEEQQVWRAAFMSKLSSIQMLKVVKG